MIVPAGVKVHLALGYTDMRKGMDGLAMLVQETLKKDPFCGHLFAWRAEPARWASRRAARKMQQRL
jgi:transposase